MLSSELLAQVCEDFFVLHRDGYPVGILDENAAAVFEGIDVESTNPTHNPEVLARVFCACQRIATSATVPPEAYLFCTGSG